MPADYDATEFVDADFQSGSKPTYTSSLNSGSRAPTREEVDSKVADAQQKLTELKRAQEELERERASLEETRRRQMEFQTGRQEMLHNLTRGVGLLEEAEFAARRDAEQMARAMTELKDSLNKLQTINEASWTHESFQTELTRALTAIENARLEWNSARLKFPILSGANQTEIAAKEIETAPSLLKPQNFLDLCKLGLAFTWPLVLVLAAALAVLLLRH